MSLFLDTYRAFYRANADALVATGLIKPLNIVVDDHPDYLATLPVPLRSSSMKPNNPQASDKPLCLIHPLGQVPDEADSCGSYAYHAFSVEVWSDNAFYGSIDDLAATIARLNTSQNMMEPMLAYGVDVTDVRVNDSSIGLHGDGGLAQGFQIQLKVFNP